jgi:hypothetical protein
MTTRAKLRRRVEPHLPRGEIYLAAFAAVGGITPRLAHRYRVVAVTDQHIHVFKASWFRVGEPTQLLASLPRGTAIVPRRTFSYDEIRLAGERLWVTPAWQSHLREAIDAITTHHG